MNQDDCVRGNIAAIYPWMRGTYAVLCILISTVRTFHVISVGYASIDVLCSGVKRWPIKTSSSAAFRHSKGT